MKFLMGNHLVSHFLGLHSCTYNLANDNSASQDFWANFAYFFAKFRQKIAQYS